MTDNLDFSALAEVLPQANSVVIFIHPMATYDAVAAATSLSLALKSAGKQATVFCEEAMRVEHNYLVGIDEVTSEISNRDLIISFAYNENQVDKVSYNIDDQNHRFELIISPKTGFSALDPNTINYSRAGFQADAIILLGYHSFSELGELYQREKYGFDHAFSVAVTQDEISRFARLHLTLHPQTMSYSELVYFMIRQLQLSEVKDDLATNLLSGIEYATDRFALPEIPARVFESVAQLMRGGAKRQPANPAFEQLRMPIRQTSTVNNNKQQAVQPIQPPQSMAAGSMRTNLQFNSQDAPASQPAEVNTPQIQEQQTQASAEAQQPASQQPTAVVKTSSTADFAQAMKQPVTQKN